MIHTLRTTAAAAALAVIAAVTVTACGSDDTATTTPTTTQTSIPRAQQWDPTDLPNGDSPTATAPTPATELPAWAADVDRSNPFQVAKTAVQVWYSWDPTTDTGPDDAAARTAPLLTSAFAAQTTSTGSVNGPGAQWLSWSSAGAKLKVSVDVMPTDGAPTTDPSRKYFIFRVTQLPYTSSGAVLEPAPPRLVAVVATEATPDTWEVSSLSER